MTITPESQVGRIATEYPLATRVFARHGIDFCCGGGKPLAEVCDKRGLDVGAVVTEIEVEMRSPDADAARWGQAPLAELIDHILLAYHQPLHEELPRLETMARKVVKVHGAKQPEMLNELLTVFVGLKAELDQHMAKEEQILFPMIRQGQGTMAGGPISVMEHEHDSASKALSRLRELTGEYTAPAEACTTWRALWFGLATLETELQEHIHLENNILFPRALAASS